ncbi:MAG: glycosyltransferase family 2 protein [Magnetococcales bacterium]|nr:glycosyltransferase family 2 protein [Magnetococcales bacterium]
MTDSPPSPASWATGAGITIALPAYYEVGAVGATVAKLRQHFPDADILVVDDGSGDGTGEAAAKAGARVIRHPHNMGNGAAIKTCARNARGRYVVFMDADGQHDADDVPKLLTLLDQGYALAVGARTKGSQANRVRGVGNALLNRFASLLTGRHIPDLTSGFRAARTRAFQGFVYLLPNGFSYPTTSTMAFMRSGLPVGFVPIVAGKRIGTSKINLIRDGFRFFVTILKVITLFSPMRVFLPASILLFTMGAVRYLYVYLESARLTNMPVLLFVASMLTFLIGLVSEQITSLHLGVSLARGDGAIDDLGGRWSDGIPSNEEETAPETKPPPPDIIA